MYSEVTGKASSDLSLLPRWHLRLNRCRAVTQRGDRCQPSPSPPQPPLWLTPHSPSQRIKREFPSFLAPNIQVRIAGGGGSASRTVRGTNLGVFSPTGFGFAASSSLWSSSAPLGVGKLRHQLVEARTAKRCQAPGPAHLPCQLRGLTSPRPHQTLPVTFAFPAGSPVDLTLLSPGRERLRELT